VRFRPEFRPAFEAWLTTAPFNNPNAPPGPLYMPQYAISEGEESNMPIYGLYRMAFYRMQ
jgi:hypothetical protein